jgi:hypothetical protein
MCCILYSKSCICIVYCVLSRLVAWQLATLTRLGALGHPWRPGVKQHHVGKNMGKTSNLIDDIWFIWYICLIWYVNIHDIWHMRYEYGFVQQWRMAPIYGYLNLAKQRQTQPFYISACPRLFKSTHLRSAWTTRSDSSWFHLGKCISHDLLVFSNRMSCFH